MIFFSLGCSGDEQDLSIKATAVCSVYEKPILVNEPLHKGTLERFFFVHSGDRAQPAYCNVP